MPRLSAGPFARRRDAARLEKMKQNPDAPARFDLELSRLGARVAPRSAVPVHTVGRGNQRARCRPRSYLSEGPERVWARHALTAAACRAGVLAMGLRLCRPTSAPPLRRRRPFAFRKALRTQRCGRPRARATASCSRRGAARRSASSCASAIWVRRRDPSIRGRRDRARRRAARAGSSARRRGRRRRGARGHRRRRSRLSAAVDLGFLPGRLESNEATPNQSVKLVH